MLKHRSLLDVALRGFEVYSIYDRDFHGGRSGAP